MQQTDVEPNQNTAHNVKAAKKLEDISSQVAQNQKDLPAAAKAITNAGSDQATQALAAANAVVGGLPNQDPVLAPQPPQPDAAQLDQTPPDAAGGQGGKQGQQPAQDGGQQQGGEQQNQEQGAGGAGGQDQQQTQDQGQGGEQTQGGGGLPTAGRRMLRSVFNRL